MSKFCKQCYFEGQCSCTGRCDYFSPLYPADEDGINYGRIIEKNRADFYSEWFQYIKDYE